MARGPGRIVVIGGGIAGLCAGVYARKCGYAADVLEMHDIPGGLATSWRREGYTFEACLHWLLGSNPERAFYRRWQEVMEIGRLHFVDPEEYVRLETEQGERLVIYADADRMAAELLRVAPEDAAEIGRMAAAVRRFGGFEPPDVPAGRLDGLMTLARVLPWLPALRRWSRISIADYGERFTNRLLRRFFMSGDNAQLSAIGLILSLGWMSRKNAGYPIGGSQAVIRLVAEKLAALGGKLRCGARVERILVEGDRAAGVALAGGETMPADWVISAADGHATIYDMLGGRYRDAATDRIYATLKPFTSYLQVSLGVGRDLSQEPGYVTRVLDAPFTIDPGTEVRQLAFRIFNFDPTFAPPGKTAVTCFLPTRNVAFWTALEQGDRTRYDAEKRRVADAVIAVLERRIPGVGKAIEVTDVTTPATIIRYTGNWQGSMEGWLMTPATGFAGLPAVLPGLRRFRMAGQWVMPGGGLPSGLLTARAALKAICREDGVRFAPG